MVSLLPVFALVLMQFAEVEQRDHNTTCSRLPALATNGDRARSISTFLSDAASSAVTPLMVIGMMRDRSARTSLQHYRIMVRNGVVVLLLRRL